MGGGDKCLLTVAGKSILSWLADRLAPQCASLLLNADDTEGRFACFALPILPDSVPDQPGPLAGILAGMEWAAAAGHEWIVSVPGDTPFIPHDLVQRFHHARIVEGAPCVVASSGDRSHPTVALWKVSLRHDLRDALLIEHVRKLRGFIARNPHTAVNWPATESFDPFFNINAPPDLAQAERMAAACDSRPDISL